MRYAAIDIGSNAIRLLISDIIQNEGKYSAKKNTLIRVPLRLGDDAFLDKKLSSKKIEDLEKTIFAFKNLLEVYRVQEYQAFATSAMRECLNGQEVMDRIQFLTKVKIEIIDGKYEAKMIYSTHIAENLDKKKNFLYIDVGGGSTELSLFTDGKLLVSNSFNIGTIRMLDNKDRVEDWEYMKNWIKSNTFEVKGIQGIGTGGNINKLFKLALEKEGIPLPCTKLKSLYQYLSSFSLKDRINVLGLKQDRADVILPAAEIFLAVCRWSGIKHIHVPKSGLVDGIIQGLIEKNLSGPPVV